MRVFVPVEDAPSGASMTLLVPYLCGFTCEHALRDLHPEPSPATQFDALIPGGIARTIDSQGIR